MKISLTVDVESLKALESALRRGHIQVDRLWTVSPVSIEDYRNAPSGIGPLASEWKDKPHRLLYDLCNRIERLEYAVQS